MYRYGEERIQRRDRDAADRIVQIESRRKHLGGGVKADIAPAQPRRDRLGVGVPGVVQLDRDVVHLARGQRVPGLHA